MRLHDFCVNDDRAIDKMAVRFSQTDNSAIIFFFFKRPKVFFLPFTGLTKTPLLPLTGFENEPFSIPNISSGVRIFCLKAVLFLP